MKRTRRSTVQDATPRVREFLSRFAALEISHKRPGEILATLLDSVNEPGPALARLIATDPDPEIRGRATIMLFTAAKDHSVSRDVRRPILRSAGPLLLRAFKDPSLDDDRKYDVGPMVALCGLRMSD